MNSKSPIRIHHCHVGLVSYRRSSSQNQADISDAPLRYSHATKGRRSPLFGDHRSSPRPQYLGHLLTLLVARDCFPYEGLEQAGTGTPLRCHRRWIGLIGCACARLPTRPHRDPRGTSPSCQGRAYNNPLLFTGFQAKLLRESMLLILTPRPQTITPHNVQTSNLQ